MCTRNVRACVGGRAVTRVCVCVSLKRECVLVRACVRACVRVCLPLTDVVYFDVWSDCVLGRGLVGVVVCLGDWETQLGEEKE